ncbi:mammalian cell entry protein [Mycobacterium sp. 21AC1]|uniref:mammalian cell entry protein n=1 Tax=[Mycobacterium] appelbergii TaxID=2939269 RepID=UPI00293912A5|nr:mammalian cell entry protein [Mycobacterium sp. 21AC1]MDV3130000.1 mammalian cell entry protein [Mycobacterium sp. 21AC1]
MEDQPADSGDLTTGTPDESEAAQAKAEKPRRRRRFPWKRGGEVAAEAEAEQETEADAADAADAVEEPPQPRVPVGKGRRAAAVEAEPEPEPEPEAEAETEPAAEAEPEAAAEPVPGTEPEPEAEGAPEPDAEPEPEAVLVPYRPAGKRLTYAAVGAAALFVAAGAFAGAMVQPYLADRALVDTKLEVAQTSADAITALWTYTPENMDALPDRAARYLSGDFANEYRKYIDAIVATNKQAQISNNTQVMGTAVESISPDEATAIVYTNSVSTSPATKNIPSLRYLSYRLTLERQGGDWRITQMPALTKMDLSPQL